MGEKDIAEGLAKGLVKGRDEGLAEAKETIIRQMIESNLLTIEQITDIVKLPVEKVKEIAQKVPILN